MTGAPTYQDSLAPPYAETELRTAVVGKKIIHHDQIDSTNRAAKACAQNGIADGAVVVAEEQTAGRGRFDRTWVSPARSDILCTIILQPPLALPSVFRLTMLASIAVVNAIQKTCGMAALIKWPNDVYVQKKKVCGILTEFEAENNRLLYALVGVGINVNSTFASNPELRDCAVSLKSALGAPVSRRSLFAAFLEATDALYGGLLATGGAGLQSMWAQHSLIMNRPVEVQSEAESIRGTARGITPDGHLLLLDEQGAEQEIICGDISLRW